MYQKYKNRAQFLPKQERLIMRPQKYGKTNLMIVEVIFGHQDVSYMKFVHSDLRLQQLI